MFCAEGLRVSRQGKSAKPVVLSHPPLFVYSFVSERTPEIEDGVPTKSDLKLARALPSFGHFFKQQKRS